MHRIYVADSANSTFGRIQKLKTNYQIFSAGKENTEYFAGKNKPMLQSLKILKS